MSGPSEITVNGRRVAIEPGSTAAAALLNAGETRFRTSVSGAPRGPLCAMGICFECRTTIEGTEHRRACLEFAAPVTEHPSGIFDLAVAGAGPAGIAAAVRAAEAGRRVVLLDAGAGPGGQIWRRSARFPAPPVAAEWLAALERSGAAVISQAEICGIAPGFRIAVESRGAALAISADRLVIATGARERFLPFPGWTLPNVFGIGGAQALAKSGTSFDGKRVVLAGSGPLLLPAAATLSRCGANVVLVAEQAPIRRVASFAASLWRTPHLWTEAARYRRAFRPARYATGIWALEAHGENEVSAVTLTDGRRRWREACDALCTGYGLVPNTELARLLGCEMNGEAVRVDEQQRASISGVFCAGEPTGIGGVELALVEGEIAGLCAAGKADRAHRLLPARERARRYASRLDRAFRLRPELRTVATPGTIVCRCEDVRLGDVDPSWSPRQAKLYTRAGMGPCQGRVCGPALAFHFGWGLDSVRFPVFPVSIGTMIETLAASKENE
jgi:D-hydroxyproline dehydrogenase subunit alpha